MNARQHPAHVGANLCAFPNGAAVATFRLAVTPRVKDGDTWRDGETSYFRVNAWRQLAEHVVPSLIPDYPEVVPAA